jgi:Flp pilus assembly protein TadG
VQPEKAAPKRRSRGERGQVIAEFGLVAIVFFMLVFGIIDMARLFQSWVAVQHAAREGARFAITGQTTCSGGGSRNACIVVKSKDATRGIFGGGVGASDSIVGVTYKAWDMQGNTWTGPSDNKSGKQCDQIEVKVTYQHKFTVSLLKVFAPSGITVNGMQRMTNEPFGPCQSGDGVG